MRSTGLGTAVGAVLLMGSATTTQEASGLSQPTVRMRVIDRATMRPEILASAEEGAIRIYRAAGVQITWLNGPSSTSGRSGTGLRSNEAIAESPPEHRIVALTTSQDLLATDPNVIARFLETARPAPVSAEDKSRVLSTLPLDGEVTDLSASARQKIAVLTELLRATGFESVYEIKVIDVPQAAIGLHARSLILVSEAALTLLDADELQASVAHEMGHGYVWTERERAFQLGDHKRLKDLELVCDAIAIVALHGLGLDASRLMSGVEKTSRFNRQRLGTANNERDYPTLAQRQAFARAMSARSAEVVARAAEVPALRSQKRSAR